MPQRTDRGSILPYWVVWRSVLTRSQQAGTNKEACSHALAYSESAQQPTAKGCRGAQRASPYTNNKFGCGPRVPRRLSKKGSKLTQMAGYPKGVPTDYWDPDEFNADPEEHRALQTDNNTVLLPHPPVGVELTQDWVMKNIIKSSEWCTAVGQAAIKDDKDRILNFYHVPSLSEATRLTIKKVDRIGSDPEEIGSNSEIIEISSA